MSFEIGRQPCASLQRAKEGTSGVYRESVVQCPYCRGLTTLCETCSKHHHWQGWESCTYRPRKKEKKL